MNHISSWTLLATLGTWLATGTLNFAAAQTDAVATKASASDLARGRYMVVTGWSLHDTSELDLRAMYQYMKHLGPAGQPAPLFVPPDKEPSRPYETRQIVP